MTPQALFNFASDAARIAENTDRGTVYPTVRQAARHFKVKQSDIEEACYDFGGNGYLGLIVGFRSGSGIASIARLGDFQVEAYPDHV